MNDFLAETANGIRQRENPKSLVIQRMSPNQFWRLSCMDIFHLLGDGWFSFQPCQLYVTTSRSSGDERKVAI